MSFCFSGASSPHGRRAHVMNIENSQMGLERKRLVVNGGWPTWGGDNVIFFHRKVDLFWGVFRFDISTGETIRVTPDRINAVTPAAININKVAVVTLPEIRTLVGTGITVERTMSMYRHIEIFNTKKPGQSVHITAKVKPRADHFNPFVIDGGKRIGYHRCNIVNVREINQDIPKGNLNKLPSPLYDVGLFRLTSGVFPAISTDGSKLAFVDNEFKAVWLADSEGLRAILESADVNSFSSLVWSQNPCKDTLYICAGLSFSDQTTLNIITIPDVSKGGFNGRQLTKGHFNNACPSTNPEGTRLVFRSTRDGGERRHKNLYIMENADVGEYGRITRLTKGDWIDTHCQWSPRGDWIVFSSTRDKPSDSNIPELDNGLDPGYYAVYLVNSNDPDVVVRVLASGYDLAGHVNHPVFSPDGRSIAVSADLAAVSVDPISLPLFLHHVRPYGDIFTVDIDTDDIYKNKDMKQFRRITHSRYENGTPTWTMLSTDDPNTQWKKVSSDKDFTPACPYIYGDGGESWQMTGHLCLEKRLC